MDLEKSTPSEMNLLLNKSTKDFSSVIISPLSFFKIILSFSFHRPVISLRYE